MQDLYNNVKATHILNPINATSTRTSDGGDLQGFDSNAVLFNIGLAFDALSGSRFWTLKLQDSDDNSTFADVADADVVSAAGGNETVIDSSSEDEAVYKYQYKGNKRYVRGLIVATGSHSSGTVVAITLLRGNANYAPVA